ncbi:MAG: hypothetical protein MUO67_07980 [Anaerolineales bacterium]|nr:hypothetical protein [Anaerolineales bacterium]
MQEEFNAAQPSLVAWSSFLVLPPVVWGALAAASLAKQSHGHEIQVKLLVDLLV